MQLVHLSRRLDRVTGNCHPSVFCLALGPAEGQVPFHDQIFAFDIAKPLQLGQIGFNRLITVNGHLLRLPDGIDNRDAFWCLRVGRGPLAFGAFRKSPSGSTGALRGVWVSNDLISLELPTSLGSTNYFKHLDGFGVLEFWTAVSDRTARDFPGKNFRFFDYLTRSPNPVTRTLIEYTSCTFILRARMLRHSCGDAPRGA